MGCWVPQLSPSWVSPFVNTSDTSVEDRRSLADCFVQQAPGSRADGTLGPSAIIASAGHAGPVAHGEVSMLTPCVQARECSLLCCLRNLPEQSSL